jgi:2-keto-4-pentenoate hydratase/2-oxohepta-3-ene-1,7-dioic acid hydratase in catechol pathway
VPRPRQLFAVALNYRALIFTGTPSGVGAHREPPIFLRDGDEVVSRIVRIGKIIQRFGAE